MSTRLDEVREDVSLHMTEILTNFKPGAKITVLVRRPEHRDGSQDFVLTNDDLGEAIEALTIRKALGHQGPGK